MVIHDGTGKAKESPFYNANGQLLLYRFDGFKPVAWAGKSDFAADRNGIEIRSLDGNSGATKVQLWDGKSWKAVTPNWVIGDKAKIRAMVDESSGKYAAEKKLTPGCLAG